MNKNELLIKSIGQIAIELSQDKKCCTTYPGLPVLFSSSCTFAPVEISGTICIDTAVDPEMVVCGIAICRPSLLACCTLAVCIQLYSV